MDADGRTVGVDQGGVSTTGRMMTPKELRGLSWRDRLGDADRHAAAGAALGVSAMADGLSSFQPVVQVSAADEDSSPLEGHGD